jgi:alpha-ketoglutarate-dependent taurine dioxygenase
MDSNAVSRWCDARREAHARGGAERWIEIEDPYRLRAAERDAVASQCARFNLALYRFAQGRSDPGALSAFASAMGLHRRDLTLGANHRGVASVRVEQTTHGPEMIPFTPRALNWHTDGYYNTPERSVRGVVMHCASPAESGGENILLDPDLVFAAMQEQDPVLVEALAHPCAMTIPAYEAGGTVVRPARHGPVFRFFDDPPGLHMRYTMRTRSIQWRPTPDTARAVTALEETIASLAACHVRVRFEAGTGVICNNVLHRRSAFVDGEDEGSRRVMLRIRSFDPVSGG